MKLNLFYRRGKLTKIKDIYRKRTLSYNLKISFPPCDIFFLFGGVLHLLASMFQIIQNYKNRKVIAEMSLEDYINAMKTPDYFRKMQIDNIRSFDRDSFEYKSYKDSSACILFNFKYEDEVNNKAIISPTGYLYIDFDNCGKKDLSSFPFITACWDSLSAKGIGILVKCTITDKNNLKAYVREISEAIGMEYDKRAISKDRCCVIGYDSDIYYNPNSTEYVFNNNLDEEEVSTESIKALYRLQSPDTFLSDKIRLSDYNEKVSNLDFKGEPFIDLRDEKMEYCEIIIPKKIKPGNRNQIIFGIASQTFGLNMWLPYNRLYSYVEAINKDKCKPPLESQEMSDIVRKVFKNESPIVVLNKKKRIIFNPDYQFKGKERMSMSASYLMKDRKEVNKRRVYKVLSEWDFEKEGKITQKKIAKVSDLSLPTIKRYYAEDTEIKGLVQHLNEEK